MKQHLHKLRAHVHYKPAPILRHPQPNYVFPRASGRNFQFSESFLYLSKEIFCCFMIAKNENLLNLQQSRATELCHFHHYTCFQASFACSGLPFIPSWPGIHALLSCSVTCLAPLSLLPAGMFCLNQCSNRNQLHTLSYSFLPLQSFLCAAYIFRK